MYSYVDFREYQHTYRYYNLICNTLIGLSYYTLGYTDVYLNSGNDDSLTLKDGFYPECAKCNKKTPKTIGWGGKVMNG